MYKVKNYTNYNSYTCFVQIMCIPSYTSKNMFTCRQWNLLQLENNNMYWNGPP